MNDSDRQGRVRGNLNFGNGRVVLIDVVTQVLAWVGYPRTMNALNAVNEAALDNSKGPKDER